MLTKINVAFYLFKIRFSEGFFVCAITLLFLLTWIPSNIFATALIVGQDNDLSTGYVASVSDAGITTALSGSGLPSGSSFIRAVAINSLDAGIIGGRHNTSEGYAAVVSSTGVTTAISGAALPASGGYIFTADINESGAGIIGGRQNSQADPYAALVSSTGVTTALSGAAVPTGTGDITAVAINSSGAGIVGGRHIDNNTPYAALVSSTGVTTALTGPALPLTSGSAVTSADINDSGLAIASGAITAGGVSAFLISSTGVTTVLSGPILPDASSSTSSAAINNSGNAIVGGTSGGTSYAFLISSSGATTAVSVTNASLVDINSSGNAIVGGSGNASTFYDTVLVSSSGTVTNLSGTALPVGDGFLFDVAISDSGLAIIGGRDSDPSGITPYVALVSSSGVVTALTGDHLPVGGGVIRGVAINGEALETIVNQAIPAAFGPGNSFANPLLALTTQILPDHLIDQKNLWNCCSSTKSKSQPRTRNSGRPNCSRFIGIQDLKNCYERQEKSDDDGIESCGKNQNYTLWSAVFGEIAEQGVQGTLPRMRNSILGGIFAFDYQPSTYFSMGAGIAYTFNYVKYANTAGHARIHQEVMDIYAAFHHDHFFFNLALFAGPYQMSHKRTTFVNTPARSHINGWLLAPHLEVSAPFHAVGTWFNMDPFVMLDLVNNWQGGVRETNVSGLGIAIQKQYLSVFRKEVGLRLFFTFRLKPGIFSIQQKTSWVNRSPLHSKTADTHFVDSSSIFRVEMLSDRSQNLLALQLKLRFMACSEKYPNCSLSYQAELGSFHSNLISFEIGKDF